MMTSFQKDCINGCKTIPTVDITFEAVIGDTETYYISNFSVADHNFTVYVYVDEAEFKNNGDWYIFESPDYKSDKELANAFLAKLNDVLATC